MKRILFHCCAGLALAVSLALVPSAAQGATSVWTIRPAQKDPLLWLSLAELGPNTFDERDAPSLRTPVAGDPGQLWRFERGPSAAGRVYQIVNHKLSRCLFTEIATRGRLGLLPCGEVERPGARYWELHLVKGSTVAGPLRLPGTTTKALYQLRSAGRGFGCLAVPSSASLLGVRARAQSCSTARNRLWTLTRGVLP